jgi:ketosteroid isomerase-like protein
MIPSLTVTTESHRVERIVEGDIATRSRETVVLLRGGVTVEFGRLFVRPYVALITVDNGWLTAGARFGLRF